MQTQIITVIVHPAVEGGYWAETLELPGCTSQGRTLEELHRNIRESIEAILQQAPFHVEIHEAPARIEFRVSHAILLDSKGFEFPFKAFWTINST